MFPEADPKKWKSLQIKQWHHFQTSGLKMSWNQDTNLYWVTWNKEALFMACPNKDSEEFFELQKLHWTLSQMNLPEIPIPEPKPEKEESNDE